MLRPWVRVTVLLRFSVKIFSVVARSWEVGGVDPPCLGEHVKPSILRLNASPVVSKYRPTPSIPSLLLPFYSFYFESTRNRECSCVCAYTYAL
ncbi:unnamed protein product, partial [Brenthis ino]